MFDLILRAWPFLALIGLGITFMVLSELLDFLFPGHGWMIMAYAVGAFGVGFIIYAHARNW